MKLVPAQSGICGFEVIQQAKFMQFSDRGGVVYYVRYRVCMWTLDFAVRNLCISIDKLYLFLKEDYYVQKIVLFNFFCFDAQHSG